MDAGRSSATAAYEISKHCKLQMINEVAEAIVSQGLDHAATVATVKAKKKAQTSRGKATKSETADAGRATVPRGARGVKVTVNVVASTRWKTSLRTFGKLPTDLRGEPPEAA